ncbi:MAG: mannose-1-phosphate guanyltransferase [Candidatus Anoxymicrobium japonicum]|uniref:Mannose-1-phosphate guanyltransferase n=1 Tax=Candidatus Anoxymicrobium japonicum TaxID=2013648 RepID=A0A2N3G892_9ACTN|nr:MAG: mannose-1-phosphate guanyltransferase [Candidatus Anoxymicrobium japonicum]
MTEPQTRNMLAVVMAGGQGTRLRPLTGNQPKPMVHVVNKPLMEHTIELLKRHACTDIVVTLQFLPTLITNYFGDGSDFGVNMSHVTEESPLGTAGSVRNARALLDRTFLVISGDALTDIDLAAAVDFHRERGAIATIVLKKAPNPLDFGLVTTSADGKIERFLEKPGWGEVFSDTINTGIYIIEPEALDMIPDDRPYDFSKELFPLMLENGFPLFGYVAEGYWTDIGNLEQYHAAHRDILEGLVDIKVPGHKLENNIWLGDGAEIDDSVNLSGPLLIGNHVKIESDSKIREYTVIGNNVVVKRDNFLHRSIIMDNTYIGPSCHIRGSVLARNCDIKSGVRIDEGAVLGNDCLVGDNAIINHGILIYPFKTVDSGATINSSIIWESRGMRSMFGKHGISGLLNVDITPEMAVKIGMAYGSTLPVNAQVVTSRDGTRSARIIKRALMAGINASGVHCRDLEVSAVPVNRFTVKSHSDQGGVDTRTNERDSQWIDINFFDEEGGDLDPNAQRKIESIYSRNNFRRAFLDELGEIYYPARAREAYAHAVEEKLDTGAIQDANFKVVFDYGYGAASLIMPGLLGKLGCEVLSLNAYTDEKRLITARPRREESLKRLGDVTLSFKADLGLFFDNAAERLAVVTDAGGILAGSNLLVTMVELVTRYTKPPGKIAIPVNQPWVIEEIAGSRGFEITRTRLDRSGIMTCARADGVIFAGSGDGGFVFPGFMPVYDAMMTFAKLLEMLAHAGEPLSSLQATVPGFTLMRREVLMSWENKGTVMRVLLETHQDDVIDSTDGIKISYDGGRRWALVLPDPQEPVLHLYAEGDGEADCKAVLDTFEAEIKNS